MTASSSRKTSDRRLSPARGRKEKRARASPHRATLAEHYLASLREQYEVREEEGGCLLLTPFLLPDNTKLGVRLVERPGGEVVVTDEGEVFDTLFLSGLNVASDDPRLATIGQRFGVEIVGGEIRKVGTAEGVLEPINDVVQAMLDVAYLIYTRRARAAPNFAGEIEQRLGALGRGYERRFPIEGASGTHRFDYRLPARRVRLVIDTLSVTARRASYHRARITAFKVVDTRRAPANEGYEFACLLDDRTPEHRDALTDQVLRALEGNLDRVVRWSAQGEVAALLAS